MLHTLDIRLKIGRKLYGELGPNTLRVGPRAVIKGPCQSAELEAMKFVARHTTIPLPRVAKTHTKGDQLFIEMDFVQGTALNRAWHTLTAEQKSQIMSELASYVSQLRALQVPDGAFIGSAERGPIRDIRIGYEAFGPYQSHEEFHSLLRGHVPLENASDTFSPEVFQCHTKRYKSLFAHGDLCARNIIVDAGRIKAIIDWEFAGWYPEYWEYTKAHYAQSNVPDFYALLEEHLDTYPSELECERILWKLLREPGQYLH